MKHYLITPNEQRIEIRCAPQNYDAALKLLKEYVPSELTGGVFRFITVEEIVISEEELCPVEVLRVGLKRYQDGAWGLVELDMLDTKNEVQCDIKPSAVDVRLWLKQIIQANNLDALSAKQIRVLGGVAIQLAVPEKKQLRAQLDIEYPSKAEKRQNYFRLFEDSVFNGVTHASAVLDRGFISEIITAIYAQISK
ncbi:MAG: hypothetical protein ACXU8A_11530 [Burkholderiaceae bacterium]